MDGGRVVRLVDQDGQLVVWQGHILHRRGGRVLAAVAAVRVGWLRGRREVDDWGLLSGIDDWATILDLGPVALVAAVGL